MKADAKLIHLNKQKLFVFKVNISYVIASWTNYYFCKYVCLIIGRTTKNLPNYENLFNFTDKK